MSRAAHFDTWKRPTPQHPHAKSTDTRRTPPPPSIQHTKNIPAYPPRARLTCAVYFCRNCATSMCTYLSSASRPLPMKQRWSVGCVFSLNTHSVCMASAYSDGRFTSCRRTGGQARECTCEAIFLRSSLSPKIRKTRHGIFHRRYGQG